LHLDFIGLHLDRDGVNLVVGSFIFSFDMSKDLGTEFLIFQRYVLFDGLGGTLPQVDGLSLYFLEHGDEIERLHGCQPTFTEELLVHQVLFNQVDLVLVPCENSGLLEILVRGRYFGN
jgi:hypothetical protein